MSDDWSTRQRTAWQSRDICWLCAVVVQLSICRISPFPPLTVTPCIVRRGTLVAKSPNSNGPYIRPRYTATANTWPFRWYSKRFSCRTPTSQMNWPAPSVARHTAIHTTGKFDTNSNRWQTTGRTWRHAETPAIRTMSANRYSCRTLHRPTQCETHSMAPCTECTAVQCCVSETYCWIPMFVCAPNCILRLQSKLIGKRN